ncbi:hypothetical protein [Chitinophaga barathri]|nr:hypothetical protein [Chitinophaga barathri]
MAEILQPVGFFYAGSSPPGIFAGNEPPMLIIMIVLALRRILAKQKNA